MPSTSSSDEVRRIAWSIASFEFRSRGPYSSITSASNAKRQPGVRAGLLRRLGCGQVVTTSSADAYAEHKAVADARIGVTLAEVEEEDLA
jgi:hypothetical protein